MKLADLSFDERLYLGRRGYEPPVDFDLGPPVSKDARLLNLIESLSRRFAVRASASGGRPLKDVCVWTTRLPNAVTVDRRAKFISVEKVGL